jgi:hypothetical protein
VPYTTVVAGTTITAAWGNANVRDQVVTPFASAAARDSAITSPVDGMHAYQQDIDLDCIYNGTAWQNVPMPYIVRKTADESLASNTTLQDDDHLKWTNVAANAIYLLEMAVFYEADAGDFKYGFTFPTGLTMKFGHSGVYDIASAFGNIANQTQAAPVFIGGIGAAIGLTLPLSGIVLAGGSSGTLQFQWAQNTSSGNATTVLTGSWGRLTRIG